MGGPNKYAIVVFLISIIIVSRNIQKFAMPGISRDPDGYVHMVIAREFRENGHRVPKKISASVFNWTFSYPYLVHLLLSFLPERYYERVDRLFPTIMDLVYIGVIITLIPIGFLDTQDLPLVLVLFLTTPQFLQYSAGKGLSARKPGIILGTLSLLSFIMWTTSGSSWVLFLSIVFAGLTHLTSRFGTQVIVLFYIMFTWLNPIALLILIGSFGVAILISGGSFLVVLHSHLLFWFDFATRKQFLFLYNGFKSVDTARRLLTARSASDILSAVYESVLVKALLNNPYSIGAAVIVISGLRTSLITVPIELIVWFGSGLIFCLMTTIYGLRFLGQPGRYLNFTFIPGSLIIVEGYRADTIMNEPFLGILIGIGLTMMAGHILSFKLTSTSVEEQQRFEEAIEYLKSRDASTVLVQPRHLGSEVAWKFQGASVNDYFGDGFCSQSAAKEAREIFEDEPYVTKETSVIEQTVDPEFVLFHKSKIGSIGDECLSPPDTEPLFENKHYSIYSWFQFKNKEY